MTFLKYQLISVFVIKESQKKSLTNQKYFLNQTGPEMASK